MSLERIGNYQLIEFVAQASFVRLYRAHDLKRDRLVWLKVFRADSSLDDTVREIFRTEADVYSRLQHPNIGAVHEAGEADGVSFLALEYLEGELLTRLIDQKTAVSVKRKVGYLVDVSRALQHAHRRSIVHRDVKPGRIFITTAGIAKLVNFEISLMTDVSQVPRKGQLVGTLWYMSPEQLNGDAPTPAVDVWGLGVTAYELLSYQKPFGILTAEVILAILSKEPPRLAELLPECPADLDHIVMNMLRKNPRERFANVDEFLPDLERLYKSLPEGAPNR